MNDEDSATATAAAAAAVAPPNRPPRRGYDADDVEPSPPPPFAAETAKPLSEPKQQQQQSDIMIPSTDASVIMKVEDSTIATATDTAVPPRRPPRLPDDADHVEPSPMLPFGGEKTKPLSAPKQQHQSTIVVPCKDEIDVENSTANTTTAPVNPPYRPPRLPDDADNVEPSLPRPFAAEITKPLSEQKQKQQQSAIMVPSKSAIDVEESTAAPVPVAPRNRPPRLPDDVDVIKPSLLPPFASERNEPLSESKQQQSTIMIPSRDPDALYSGGGISFLNGSRNARFNYGYASFKGKRASMEDYFETRISEVDGQMVAFFGVFDGHGGSRTAEYLKDNLFKNLTSHPDFKKDTKTAIVEAFRQTDADYLSGENSQQRDAGSTASTALLLDDRILVANVGDSRVVACRAGSAIPLSIDHKPDRSDERERIEQAGGFIIWAGTWRVGGVLAVSRAFGDKLLKPYVVAEPEIQEEEIEGFEFLIIASDGLWNVISNKDAVAIVQEITDAEAASRKLIEESFTRGSSDNITCIVVRFENP